MQVCWNGRQARLRCVCFRTCGFKSHHLHHNKEFEVLRILSLYTFRIAIRLICEKQLDVLLFFYPLTPTLDEGNNLKITNTISPNNWEKEG